MVDIVLLKEGGNELLAEANFIPILEFTEAIPESTDTMWSKLKSLKPKLPTVKLKGYWHEKVEIRSLTLSLGGATQKFPLPKPSLFPGLLFFSDTEPRLMTVAELNGDIEVIGDALEAKGGTIVQETKNHAKECSTLAKEALKRELQRREFEWQEVGFLGIQGIGSAAISVQSTLTVDVAALLDGIDEEVELLRASLSFRAAANTKGGSGFVDAWLKLVIKANPKSFADAAATFLSSFDLPQLPNVPRPRLRFPEVALPSLTLEGFKSKLMPDFLDFDLKLPKLTPPVKVVWTTVPVFSVTQLSPLKIKIQLGDGELRSVSDVLATLTGISLAYDGGTGIFEVNGQVGKIAQIDRNYDEVKDFDLGGRLPFTIDISDSKTTISTNTGFDLSDLNSTANAGIKAKLILGRIVVRSKEDPRLYIVFAAEFDAAASAAVDDIPILGARLTSLKVIEPDPAVLICAVGTAVSEGVLRLIAMIPAKLLVLERLSDLLASALKWIARKAAEEGAALSLLAEAGLETLGRLIEILREADNQLSCVVIEVRLDAETYHPRQILISSASLAAAIGVVATEVMGLKFTIPRDWRPSLLIDVSGPLFAALLVEPSSEELKIATDLWLDRDGAPPQSAADTDEAGQRPTERLITLTATKDTDLALALIAVDGGRVSYFQVLKNKDDLCKDDIWVGNSKLEWQVPVVRERPALRSINFGTDVTGSVKIAANRVLPFFSAPAAHPKQGNFLEQLGQYLKVEGSGTPKVIGSTVEVPLKVELKVRDFKTQTVLQLTLDLSTLSARITGGDALVIRDKRKHGTMFGLEYVILPRSKETPSDGEFNQFQFDLSGGNPRMALHPDAEVKLYYRRLGGQGKGLVFRVDDFGIAKSGFDLTASVDPNEPVVLPGVDMPFRFSGGQLILKNGQILAFSITGSGQLPPELIGEASCKVKIMLGPSTGGDLAVLGCDAELDKNDDPIVCHSTRFTLSIGRLGFAVQDFGNEGGYQFYFLISGTIMFTPPGDEFAQTFLKYLRGTKLTLTKAPLARDTRLLARAIQIQVPLETKVQVKLFEIFSFEVRAFGFHSVCDAFGGSPALNIAGQVKFHEVGDAISAKIDCHSLWLAPPKPGAVLPRVRFDGLTVVLSLGGVGIEATAMTVDENLPELERPFKLPQGVTANGFLASGQLKMSGWAPMTASMGFLELAEKKNRFHAFYIYGQMEKLSELVPTPVKELYLREAGFGVGYRYTLAGLARADEVTKPDELIKILDDVSRYQNDLAKFSAWQPEIKSNRITLAMRALATVASPYSSSEEVRLEEKRIQASGEKAREEGFANPLLFDMAIALRSDLTLLMTARAWLSVNYHTWTKNQDISTKPPLRGYLYLSVPRQVLLGRLVSDPTGLIGDTPVLPNELVEAFKSVNFSATLYIRPGLYHFEFGWPYELKLNVPREPNKNFGMTAEGGLVFRVEDFSLLYGIAIRARGFAQIGGSIGGRSLGASALARADFSLDAKFIAYLSLKQADETLFYGYLAFSCRISFEIKFWLEINVFFGSIKLSAAFSQSLGISVALELAIGPKVLAGRATAEISVGAFGRSLSLSVGFGFNESALEEARRKVERFLALGLTSAVPDPAAGLAPPPAAPPPKAEALDQRAKQAATLQQIDKAPVVAPVGPYVINLESQFQTFTPNTPLFWAILFEIPAKPRTYVLQLVPRDATQAFEINGADAATFDLHTIEGGRSTFYGPAGTKFKFLTESNLLQLSADGDEVVVSKDSLIGPNMDAEVAVAGDKKLTLKTVLEEVYLTEKVKYNPNDKRIIERIGGVIDVDSEAITLKNGKAWTRAEAEAELAAAADASAMLSVPRALLRGVEEKRSALISAICSSAEQIAREATLEEDKVVWPKRPKATAEGVFDARDFGLTFVVSEKNGGIDDTLNGLFTIEGQGKQPPKACFKVQLVDAEGEPMPVRLFNPPSRFFNRANPRLARLTYVHDSRGIVLDWDLEPAWEGSANVWHDPEFHLKSYRIQRVFKVNGGLATTLKPLELTTKAAAPLKPVVTDSTVQWEKIAPPVQFVDDFADLPADLRPALLRTTLADPGKMSVEATKKVSPFEAWEALVKRLQPGSEVVELAYTITAIDIAGHEAVPVPFELSIKKPEAVVPRIAQAELFINYDSLPGASKNSASVVYALRLDDHLAARPEDRKQPQRLAPDGTKYLLRIRRETSTQLGIYGADAVTTALKRPTPDQFGTQPVKNIDTDFELRLAWGSNAHENKGYDSEYGLSEIEIAVSKKKDQPAFVVHPEKMEVLKKAMGFDPSGAPSEPRSIRVAICRIGDATKKRSEWLVVDTRLRIGKRSTNEVGVPQPYPVDTVVETFESPKAVGFSLLGRRDLKGDAGRLLIDYPAAGATLDDLIAGKGALQRLRDGDRRVATKVLWSALPEIEAGRQSLIGGYDVFEADLAESMTQKDVIHVAEHIARAAALDPLTAAGAPATIDDYGAIEAFYPSETLRLSKRKGAGSAARRQAWFSTAESLGVWPEVGIKRSVGLDISDAEVAQLFTLGAPTSFAIRFEGTSAAVLLKIAEKLGNHKDLPVFRSLVVDYQTDQTLSLDPDSDGQFKSGEQAFTYTSLRRMLHGLVIDGSTDDKWWNEPLRKSFAEHRAALRGLTLEIEAKYEQVSLGTITHKIDLDTALHPVLADVFDAVRWHVDDKTFYRRYEPVLDPAPSTDAKTIEEFLDQRPLERDPYGWAILRTLGLAVGFRISDTLSGDFLVPDKAIERVRDAFKTILPRYRKDDSELLQLGQPFVDLMTRPGGLYTIASFDGGDPTPGDKVHEDLLKNELVSLVQIALRPVAEYLADQNSLRSSRYYAVSLKKKAGSFIIDMTRKSGLVDLIFLDTLFSSSSLATFADTTNTENKELISRLSGDRPIELKREYTIPTWGVKRDTPFALLRVTWPSAKDHSWIDILKGATGKCFKIEAIESPCVIGSSKVEAFERFPELPARAITALLEADKTLPIHRFLTLARARFGEDGVPKPEKLDAFFARWPDLMRRFFAHGPSKHREITDQTLPFSLALMPRPLPLRTKVQDDGWMKMIVVHKDRQARRRRYFVRPFGRYDNLATAWDAANPKAIPWTGRRSLADSIEGGSLEAEVLLPQIKLEDIDNYSLDITLARSEPLAPLVVLSARRLDVGEGTQQRPGKLIEFVVARHQEEIVSESNITVADSHQFEHLAFGLYRGFRDIAWATKLEKIAEWPRLDLLPEVIYEGTLDKTEELSFPNSNSFSEAGEQSEGVDLVRHRKELTERSRDGWRGITALRLEDVPHFYRVHALVFAAAGVVVSKPVVATVPEGMFTLSWPWADNSLKPTWSVTEAKGQLRVMIQMPLVRYFDGMTAGQKHWAPTEAQKRRVYDLPDPGVAYEVATCRSEGSGTKDEQVGDEVTEVALVAQPGSGFLATWPGPMFAKINKQGWETLLPAFGANGWILEIELKPANPHSFPSVTGAIPITLRDASKKYVHSPKLKPSPGLEFLSRLDVTLEGNPSNASEGLDELLTYLEGRSLYAGQPGVGFEAAIEALERLKLTRKVELLLPTVIHPDIKTRIDAIEGAAATLIEDGKPIALTLRRPPTDDEVRHVREMGGAGLLQYVDRLATDQIFGTGRIPRLKATKGFLDALYAVIARKED